MDGPLHGYEVRRTLELWGADGWANIAYGSIYSGLKTMANDGLVEVAGEQQRSRGVPRTVYAITEAGRQEFMRLLREHWWEAKPTIHPFQTALTFMPHLDREELLSALRHRAMVLKAQLERLEYLTDQKVKAGAPPHVAENVRLAAAHVGAELGWLEEVAARVERGEVP